MVWIVGIFNDKRNFPTVGRKKGFVMKDRETCISQFTHFTVGQFRDRVWLMDNTRVGCKDSIYIRKVFIEVSLDTSSNDRTSDI